MALKRRLAEEAKERRKVAREEKKERLRAEDAAFEAKEGELRAMHARLTKHYFLCFKEARGVAPIFDGADGKALYRLIEGSARDEAKIQGMIAYAFKDSFLSKTANMKSMARNPSLYLYGSPAKGRHVQATHTGPIRYLGDP